MSLPAAGCRIKSGMTANVEIPETNHVLPRLPATFPNHQAVEIPSSPTPPHQNPPPRFPRPQIPLLS
jgi:hypothetical protein